MPGQKLCLFCDSFFIDSAEPGYSEYTPGSDLSIECTANHWDIDNDEITTERYTKNMMMAEQCEDFEPSSLAKELGLVD